MLEGKYDEHTNTEFQAVTEMAYSASHFLPLNRRQGRNLLLVCLLFHLGLNF